MAVIDGSTSKSTVSLRQDMTNGKFCSSLLQQFISNGMRADATINDFCNQATEFVHQSCIDAKAEMDGLKVNPACRPTASIVVYSRARNEVWMVGDCQAMRCDTKEKFNNDKPYEKPIAEMRSAMIRLLMLEGHTLNSFMQNDEGRSFIMPYLIDTCKYQNVTFSVVDGFTIPMDKVRQISLADCHGEVVLASDGYPVLCPTLSESEDALARQLSDDPLCVNSFKATKGLMNGNKSFDDRSYIRFSIE